MQIIRDAYYKEKNIQEKQSFADLVTETDTGVERALVGALKLQYPTHKYVT